MKETTDSSYCSYMNLRLPQRMLYFCLAPLRFIITATLVPSVFKKVDTVSPCAQFVEEFLIRTAPRRTSFEKWPSR